MAFEPKWLEPKWLRTQRTPEEIRRVALQIWRDVVLVDAASHNQTARQHDGAHNVKRMVIHKFSVRQMPEHLFTLPNNAYKGSSIEKMRMMFTVAKMRITSRILNKPTDLLDRTFAPSRATSGPSEVRGRRSRTGASSNLHARQGSHRRTCRTLRRRTPLQKGLVMAEEHALLRESGAPLLRQPASVDGAHPEIQPH